MIKILGWGHHGDQGYTNIEYDTSEESSLLSKAIDKINKDLLLVALATEFHERQQ